MFVYFYVILLRRSALRGRVTLLSMYFVSMLLPNSPEFNYRDNTKRARHDDKTEYAYAFLSAALVENTGRLSRRHDKNFWVTFFF